MGMPVGKIVILCWYGGRLVREVRENVTLVSTKLQIALGETDSWRSYPWAQFTQDTEHLATHARKRGNTLWSMGVFTQLPSNIKGFAHKFARKSVYAFCVNGPLESQRIFQTSGPPVPMVPWVKLVSIPAPWLIHCNCVQRFHVIQ